MRPDFSEWLSQRYPAATGTKSSRLANVKRIEEYYGSLDDHFIKGTYQQEVINTLEYSAQNMQTNKPNPSKIPFEGDIRNNLSMYKNAAKLYLTFLEERGVKAEHSVGTLSAENTDSFCSTEDIIGQRLSLERDMQEALRRNIASLEPALRIIDDGVERSVDSGFIDITCEDDKGIVVIELKAGKADSRAIGQILGYMGDLQEEVGKPVRGILVAHDFDKRARSAARVVPTLTLQRYFIEFKFMAED